MELPGYKEALDLGYTLCYYGSDKKSATYMKQGVALTILSSNVSFHLYAHNEARLEARLELVWGLLIVKTPSFDFPNENFKVFESQVFLAKDRLGEDG